ncbi:Bcemw1 [Botrytis cinerea B05.10]|uniref:Bcemw1 n=2 Tax=Botryotinia fuckeliana TaxID=40559 RepID=A0A384JY26_BOTFB|nr:Bcemw1 [Botrytis cinerea B05.10]ATZ55473.1 Bcemw1 [Botrytis cinerea B05.10]EMR87937.1 putative tpr repeat-containing protein [Botrytis cinerea BcDW1]
MSFASDLSTGGKGGTLDAILFNLEQLKELEAVSEIVTDYLNGDYKAVLRTPTAQILIQILAENVNLSKEDQTLALKDANLQNREVILYTFITGLAAFNAFLQTNVTGPSVDFGDVFQSSEWNADELREKCLRSLDVDGVSVYQFIPKVELFCLARYIFTTVFPRRSWVKTWDCKWMRIRINAYHQRLLSGYSMNGRMSDSTVLQDLIEQDLKDLESEVLVEESPFGTDAKVMFLLEKAQIYIMEGLDLKARENVKKASEVSGFEYALSGALGKRTKFQQTDISQLVVFAKSREDDASTKVVEPAEKSEESVPSSDVEQESTTGPQALELNDDTLLESIEFAKTPSDKVDNSNLPAALAGMKPDEQPQLHPLDQIALLTEATLKDTLSPLDKLNSEEILPYAVRVLSDKPTNWQIYTQALLVRSRIEAHRSRTQERSVLQLQVIVDQIIADTQESTPTADADGVPQIQVTSFLPRAKAGESAPVTERLRYVNQLNTPTRWEIETELAFAWSNAGSLVSALEIFKRLKMWAEVALCYHSVAQEDKARQIVRRQLYYSSQGPEMDKYDIDADAVVKEQWDGEMRTPPPPHAPRLWCILGDLDQDPTCWQRAWEISKNRYARAQRTLGDYYTRKNDLTAAREAYLASVVVNRQNNDTWSRLGDIDLKTGNWDGAVIAFQQSIMIDDTDAKTYSNLGSALLSKHDELVSLQKIAKKEEASTDIPDDEEIEFSLDKSDKSNDPKEILRQALMAYKRGAAIAHNNWKIWDNVITIATRMSPPAFPEILMGLRNILRIRAPNVGEYAIDMDILSSLVIEVVSRDKTDEVGSSGETGIWVPKRGTLARAVIEMMDRDIVPLITKRVELYEMVEKLRLWQRDYKGALEAAEKAWRMSMNEEGWLEKEDLWMSVVGTTERLVGAYENFGEEGKWKGKARSAVRGVMGKGKDFWEGTKGWETLEGLMEELKA